VVKNVTGYDLCKVFAGSWGTLAAMTEVTLKVLPKPETEATVLVAGLTDAQACAAMAAAMGSPCDVSGAAHVPDHLAACFEGLPKTEAATVLRLEGFAPSVKHRQGTLSALMQSYGAVTILNEAPSRALWRSIRDVKAFALPSARHRSLWRLSLAPASAHRLVDFITPAAQMLYDWAGGLVWIGMPYAGEPDARSVRNAIFRLGGHATLLRAPAAVRAGIDVFQPEEPPLAGVTRRVKESFDPKGVLNPGRMWAGI
jgi:glycolate oxidase FAD binding subunit